MRRDRLTLSELYTRLNTEFRALRPRGCSDCRMPLPVPMERPDTNSANWRIGMPRICEHGCHGVIVEIAARCWPKYDLVEGWQYAAEPGLRLQVHKIS